jgi:hypothetical protein
MFGFVAESMAVSNSAGRLFFFIDMGRQVFIPTLMTAKIKIFPAKIQMYPIPSGKISLAKRILYHNVNNF